MTPTPLSEDQVGDILTTSHRNNPAKEITGLLCYDGHRFLQILEGAEDNIHALYKTIHSDPRHTAIELLHEAGWQIAVFQIGRWLMNMCPKAYCQS
ncbi:BLUF domain-containing protein [Litorimonas sp. RW-G-Af-16]|uniref:BLUF domain-containing protein n=1 Tax=Litorimonas sp. RW-G-Af-16 TaxID=3241168 RepID=UPI003AABAB0A